MGVLRCFFPKLIFLLFGQRHVVRIDFLRLRAASVRLGGTLVTVWLALLATAHHEAQRDYSNAQQHSQRETDGHQLTPLAIER